APAQLVGGVEGLDRPVGELGEVVGGVEAVALGVDALELVERRVGVSVVVGGHAARGHRRQQVGVVPAVGEAGEGAVGRCRRGVADRHQAVGSVGREGGCGAVGIVLAREAAVGVVV